MIVLPLKLGTRRSSQIHTTYRSRVSTVLPEELDRSIYINASFACSKVKTLSILGQSALLAHLETAPRWALLRALDTDLVVAPYSMYNIHCALPSKLLCITTAQNSVFLSRLSPRAGATHELAGYSPLFGSLGGIHAQSKSLSHISGVPRC